MPPEALSLELLHQGFKLQLVPVGFKKIIQFLVVFKKIWPNDRFCAPLGLKLLDPPLVTQALDILAPLFQVVSTLEIIQISIN